LVEQDHIKNIKVVSIIIKEKVAYLFIAPLAAVVVKRGSGPGQKLSKKNRRFDMKAR
jgi:hypothetical protein